MQQHRIHHIGALRTNENPFVAKRADTHTQDFVWKVMIRRVMHPADSTYANANKWINKHLLPHFNLTGREYKRPAIFELGEKPEHDNPKLSKVITAQDVLQVIKLNYDQLEISDLDKTELGQNILAQYFETLREGITAVEHHRNPTLVITNTNNDQLSDTSFE